MKPPITAILEHYGAFNLPDYGGWRPVKCPFHSDRHASASVNPNEGVYRCHACDYAGDAYAIVMAAEGIGFKEAKEKIAQITGVRYEGSESRTGPVKNRSLLPAWTRTRTRKKAFA